MSETATETNAESKQQNPGDLHQNLLELGEALPVSFQPNAHTAGPLLAGLIYYIATGSLVPPRVEIPDQAAERAELAEQTALNEERARVVELERELAASKAGPSPVAPAPAAPVDTAGQEAKTEVAAEPAPTPPTTGGMFGDEKAEKAAKLRAELAALEAGEGS